MRIIATGKNEKICTHYKILFINETLLLSSVLIGSKQIVIGNGLQCSSPRNWNLLRNRTDRTIPHYLTEYLFYALRSTMKKLNH